MRKLEKLLNNYEVELEFFRPEDVDDACLLYSYRKILAENESKLSPKEKEKLEQLDRQALNLLKKLKGEKGEGLFYLELLVKEFIKQPVETSI